MRKAKLFDELVDAQELTIFFENCVHDILTSDPAYSRMFEELMKERWNVNYLELFARAIEWSAEVSYRGSSDEKWIYVCFREEDEVEYSEFYVRGEYYTRLIREIESRWIKKKSKTKKS